MLRQTPPRPLLVNTPGGTEARLAVERQVRERGWRFAASPAEANLLVVAGPAAHALEPYLDRVWRSIPAPRARADIPTALDALTRLEEAVDRLRGDRRESEFVVLVLLAALGAVLLAGAGDLLLPMAAYLLASVPLYALTGSAKDATGTEASLKYYLLGALLGVFLLFGVMLLFGAGEATRYAELSDRLPAAPIALVVVGGILVLAGLLFKAGAVPAHFWVPDVTEGARPGVGALVTTVPKIGAVIAIHRLVQGALQPADLDWGLLLALIAAVMMTLGNLAAFFQNNVRRLLAYSTISQVGYLLMALAAAGHSTLALPALLLYLGAYAVTPDSPTGPPTPLTRPTTPPPHPHRTRTFPGKRGHEQRTFPGKRENENPGPAMGGIRTRTFPGKCEVGGQVQRQRIPYWPGSGSSVMNWTVLLESS